jgi:hypothetical protein
MISMTSRSTSPRSPTSRLSGMAIVVWCLSMATVVTQNMWRSVAPQFEDQFRVVHCDLTYMGQSDLGACDFGPIARFIGTARVQPIFWRSSILRIVFWWVIPSGRQLLVLPRQSAPVVS